MLTASKLNVIHWMMLEERVRVLQKLRIATFALKLGN